MHTRRPVTAAKKPTKSAPAKSGYHHGDLRRALMDSALALVREGGPGALSLREAARRAGVSVAAPYHHFASREALLEALCDEGFRELESRGASALASAGTRARDRLSALGLSYVRFARERPAHFQLMFSAPHGAAPTLEPDAIEKSLGAFTQLVDAVRASQSAGEAPSGDPRGLVLIAWTVVHGLATLAIQGPLAHGMPGFDVAPSAVDALAIETLQRLFCESARATADTVARGAPRRR